MKTTPMLFNGEMVRALLDGRKVQTRRIVKGVQNDNRMKVGGHIVTHVIDATKHGLCPYGQPGDLIWVRETHAFVPRTAYAHSEGVEQTIRPDDDHYAAIYREGFDLSPPAASWRPSIHMPRWASRLTLTITDIRIERVQDISEEDSKAEGIKPCAISLRNAKPDTWEDYLHRTGAGFESPIESFKSLWESTYPGSWERNDWVWVISFEVILENVDRAITNLQEISG